MFKANNNATVLKIDTPKNVQNLNIVETNNGELAFEYDHTNVFANLLVKNSTSTAVSNSFIIMLKRKTQENGGHQNLLLRSNA